MTDTHLTPERWRALQGDPTAHRELIAHVASGCEVCDAVIGGSSDPLDGELDRALLSLAPPAQAPLDEVGYMRVRRALKRGPALRGPVVAVLALAAAAALVVGVSLRQPAERGQGDGIKGSTSAGPRLELAAARQQGSDSFVRLDDGARLSSGAVLVFQANSSVTGPARIFLQRNGGAPVEVGHTMLEAGTHEVRSETGVLGLTMDGEKGDVTVWVVVGAQTFSPEAASHAIDAHGSDALGVAKVQVHVD